MEFLFENQIFTSAWQTFQQHFTVATILESIIKLSLVFLIYKILFIAKSFIVKRFSSDWESEQIAPSALDIVTETLRSTFRLWLFAVSVGITFAFFEAAPNVLSFINKAVLYLTIFQFGAWAAKAAKLLIIKIIGYSHDSGSRSAQGLLVILSHILVWVITFLLLLDNANVDITALIAGLGIGGIAIALAVQNILGDLLASLSIILDKPFVVGETIKIGELVGTVERIGIKTTRIRELGGEEVVVSNAELLKTTIRNFKRMNRRRITFSFDIRYETPLEKIKQVPEWIKQIIDEDSMASFVRAHFKHLAESGLTFEVVYSINSAEIDPYLDAQQRINIALCDKFNKEGVSFAYQTRTLIVEGSLA